MDRGELAQRNSSGIWHCFCSFFPDFFLSTKLPGKVRSERNCQKWARSSVLYCCISLVFPWEGERRGCSGYFGGEGEFVGRHEVRADCHRHYIRSYWGLEECWQGDRRLRTTRLMVQSVQSTEDISTGDQTNFKGICFLLVFNSIISWPWSCRKGQRIVYFTPNPTCEKLIIPGWRIFCDI